MRYLLLLLPALIFGDVGYFDQPENDLLPQTESPTWVPRPPNLSGKEIFEADELWRIGEAGEIIKQYKPLLKKDPNHPLYQYRVGEAYRRLSNFKKAKKHLENAVTIHPGYIEARIALGFTYLGLNEPKKAYDQFALARIESPENVDAQYGLALSLIRLNRRVEAYQVLNDAIARAPTYDALVKTKADIDLYFNRYKQAYEGYKELESKDPSREYEAKLMRIRMGFKPHHQMQVGASQEEEKDLVTRIKTTRIVNFLGAIDSAFPVTNKFSLTTRFFWNREVQKNLVAGVNNYSVNKMIFGVGGTYRFNDDWYAQVQSQLKTGRNHGRNVFDFVKKDLIENSASVRYIPGDHALAGGFTQYSFVGRNFNNDTSFYVQVRPQIFCSYNYQYAPFSNVGFLLQKGWYRAEIPNAKTLGQNWIRYRIPGIQANIIAEYQGEYSYFRNIDPDYNTYKKGQDQRIGLSYLNIFQDGKLEIKWRGGWVHEQDFTNVAEIIASGSPPPPEVIPVNVYLYTEWLLTLQKNIGERFQFESDLSVYRNSNSYFTLLGKAYLRMVF